MNILTKAFQGACFAESMIRRGLKNIFNLFVGLLAFSMSTTCNANEQINLIAAGKQASVFVKADYKVGNSMVSKTGTGFIIDTSKSPGLAVITNKHILQHNINGQTIIPFHITVKVNMSDLVPTLCDASIVALHDNYDLGLLHFKLPQSKPPDAVLKTSSDGIEYYSIKSNAFLLEDSVIDDEDLREGLEVLFSGFPLDFGADSYHNYPVTRKGMIAQVLLGAHEIVIDGFASHGNSGSPVYCVTDKGLKLVGIQEAVYSDSNIGYDEKGRVNSLSTFNSGLSLVIKSSVIKEFVYKLIEDGRYKGDWSKRP